VPGAVVKGAAAAETPGAESTSEFKQLQAELASVGSNLQALIVDAAAEPRRQRQQLEDIEQRLQQLREQACCKMRAEGEGAQLASASDLMGACAANVSVSVRVHVDSITRALCFRFSLALALLLRPIL